MEANQAVLETAIQAVRAAGRVLVERLPDERQVRVKGFRDIVTDADVAAEQAIVEIIRGRFPDHALLAEEEGESEGDVPYLWVVDPLDGTTNYNRRFPNFSVSIGIAHKRQLVAGAVYDPLRDHLFAAQKGRGATLNGAPLQVSDVDALHHAVVGLDWAHAQETRREIVGYLSRIAPACGTLRGIGTAALALCYVAAGWLDTYFHIGLQPWDLAAGLLIIEEAGGRVTDIEGQPWQPWGQRILVSNGLLHRAMVELMNSQAPLGAHHEE